MYLCGDQAAGQFADQLLTIGDGRFPTDDDTIDVIQLPEAIGTFKCNIDELVHRLAFKLYKHCLVIRVMYFGTSKQDHSHYQHNYG